MAILLSSQNSKSKKTKIGVIVGGGTGRELADVFRMFMLEMCSIFNLEVSIEEESHEIKTYWGLRNSKWEDIENIEKQDFERLWAYLRRFYDEGGRIIYRTAINAEVLYQLRKKGLAVKVFPAHLKDGRKILMIRDEMEGFYTNDEHRLSDEVIEFTGSFHSDYLRKIYDYAIQVAQKYLADDFEIWALYKYHLFANLLEKWCHMISDKIKIYQPDSGIDLLIKYVKDPTKYPNDLLLLTGNEIGDILCEFLMYILDMGNKDVLFSRDVFLCPELYGLIMYQTIHGSADDIAGLGIVNPFATLRAIGDLIENCLHKAGFKAVMEDALQQAQNDGIVTPDLGGRNTTDEVVKYVLLKIKNTYGRKH